MSSLRALLAAVSGVFCIGLLVALFAFAATSPRLVQAELRSTVLVEPTSGSGHGSGVIVGPGLVLTARHVAEVTENEARFTFYDGEIVIGELVWKSEQTDLALFSVEVPAGYAPAVLDCTPLQIGEKVSVVGNPLAMRWAYSEGIFSTADIPGDTEGLVAITAQLAPGNSGGPVFDAEGHLVGILVAAPIVNINFSPSLGRWGLMVPAGALCGTRF